MPEGRQEAVRRGTSGADRRPEMLAVGHRAVVHQAMQGGVRRAVSHLGMQADDLRVVGSREMQVCDHQAAVHPEVSKAAGIIARRAGLRRAAEAGPREAETAEAWRAGLSGPPMSFSTPRSEVGACSTSGCGTFNRGTSNGRAGESGSTAALAVPGSPAPSVPLDIRVALAAHPAAPTAAAIVGFAVLMERSLHWLTR